MYPLISQVLGCPAWRDEVVASAISSLCLDGRREFGRCVLRWAPGGARWTRHVSALRATATITRRDHPVTPIVGSARCVPPAQGHRRPLRVGLPGGPPSGRDGRLGRSFSRSIGAGKGLFTQQKISAPGGSRTHTEALLRGLPLPIGLRGRADSVRADPNRWEKCAIRVAAIAYRVLTAVNRHSSQSTGRRILSELAAASDELGPPGDRQRLDPAADAELRE